MSTLTLKGSAATRRTAPASREAATPWHNLSVEVALDKLSARPEGLTASEAAVRLARTGRNEIVRRRPISPLRLLLNQFGNFFVLVLLFAAGLAAVFGVVPLDWRAWAVMVPVVAGSSLAGVYMTRWILKLVPLWEG